MTSAPTGDPGSDRSRVWNHTLFPVPGVYTVDAVHTFVGFAAQFGPLAELSKEPGSMLIGDDVALEIEAEATRQP
jgi:hypothetical protein